MREIGKKLNVAPLLEGSVRKAGKRIRVTAQLINVADGYHLWSDQYDRNLVDIFGIQDDIAKNIVQALRLQLTDKEKDAIEKAPTRNVEAYEFYLRGREFFHRGREKTIRHAIEMFDRATRKDSHYALAYARGGASLVRCGDEAFEAARAEGRKLSWEDVIDQA